MSTAHFRWSSSYAKLPSTDKLSKYAQFLFARFRSQLIRQYLAASHISGLRVPSHPLKLLGALLRIEWWNSAGFDSLWVWRNSRKHLYLSFCKPSGWRAACKCTITTEVILSPSPSVLLPVAQHYTPPISTPGPDRLLAEVINPVPSNLGLRAICGRSATNTLPRGIAWRESLRLIISLSQEPLDILLGTELCRRDANTSFPPSDDLTKLSRPDPI